MRWEIVLFTTVAVALSGCATGVEKGFAAYNRGSFDQAAAEWNGPAQRGDAAAQYNIGLLWENGHGSTPKNLDQAAEWYLRSAQQGFVLGMLGLARVQLAMNNRVPAISWLTLAARWNDQSAITTLMSLREPVPAPDLFAQRQQAEQQALGQMGYALGCAMAGGCGPRVPVQTPSPPIDLNCTPTTFGSANPNYRCRER
jgi:TPR repeat protein